MSYTSLFSRPCPPPGQVTRSLTASRRYVIDLTARPVTTAVRPTPPSLFALRARPGHDVVMRPLAVAA